MLFKQPLAPPQSVKTFPKAAGKSPSTAAEKKEVLKPVALPVEEGTQAAEITVESKFYRVTFSTQGAVVKSWVLRKFKDENGKPLDVVNREACAELGYPMSLSLPNNSLAKNLNEAIYVATPAVGPLKAPVTVQFVYSNGKVEVQKQFSFGLGYEVRAKVRMFNGQHSVPVAVAWPGGVGDHSLPIALQSATSEAVYDTGRNLETVSQSKVTKRRLVSPPLSFAGLEDRYFAGIFIPDSPHPSFQFLREPWVPAGWTGKKRPETLVGLWGNSQGGTLDFGLFVAPKQLDVLDTTQPPLGALVDFGWFSFIAKPLFLAMHFIYDHWVHNYGWAIVILTVLINMLLFPLKLKAIRSAQEMQRIMPHMKAIQDRYKQYKFNDPRKQKMNQEVMKLYHEHGINPLGGCIPMVLQLPILYGFYETLETPIELRRAPWILWIKDLSMPDHSHLLGLPIPILPTIMIVTMFLMTKMTPMAVTDPSQKRMMMLMPLIFGLMFYRFASGLVLYFLTANLVGIAQQVFINRFFTPKKPPLGAPKAALGKA
ncbi:MAG: membrane protein insertase YidC [Acidobacteria bacterium]|nr:membrane protein insertase YidC [Acidobacteriota bacterium]